MDKAILKEYADAEFESDTALSRAGSNSQAGGPIMKCSICGRKLSNPQSRELGYGPVCYSRKFGIIPYASRKNGQSSVDDASDYNLPGQMTIDEYLGILSGQ